MANAVKGEQLYEGKAKKVFATSDPDLVIVSYKDDATAGDGAKRGTIKGKILLRHWTASQQKIERKFSYCEVK